MSDQERFKELFEKGYKNLDMPTRKEYSALKAKLEKSTPIPENMTKDISQSEGNSDSEDRITRLEKMVDSLTNENFSLRKETSKLEKGWAEYESPIARNKIATLKVYRKDADAPAGVIIKLVTFKNNAFDEETRKRDKLIYTLTIMYDNNEIEDLKMDAREFAEMKEIEEVEIIGEDSRTLKKVDGYVRKPNMDKDKFPKRVLSGGSGYGMNIGSQKVSLNIFMVKSTVTVKRSSGQEITLESDYLNM